MHFSCSFPFNDFFTAALARKKKNRKGYLYFLGDSHIDVLRSQNQQTIDTATRQTQGGTSRDID